MSRENSQAVLIDFLKVFIAPTIFNKTLMLYFGVNYSFYPGMGYGYGLVATLVFMVFTMGRFIWKYRNIEDP